MNKRYPVDLAEITKRINLFCVVAPSLGAEGHENWNAHMRDSLKDFAAQSVYDWLAWLDKKHPGAETRTGQYVSTGLLDEWKETRDDW